MGDGTTTKELPEIRRDCLELEKAHGRERECLLKVINAYGIMLGDDPQFGRQVQAIRRLVNDPGPLPLDSIEKELSTLKKVILCQDHNPEAHEKGQDDRYRALEGLLVEACEFLRKLSWALIENFYPLNKRLQEMASTIRVDCGGETVRLEFPEATKDLLEFLEELKRKISDDFRYINHTFLLLLEQVRELEESFAVAFGGKERLKEIEYFETRINREVGSIAHSFNIYETIHEIKSVVIEKIKNIRIAVSLRKKEELKKAQDAQENIEKLLRRISEAEKDARELAKKAEEFQMAAMKDGLTGLHNRKAFDLKAGNALESFMKGKENFSLILFDVDNFKEINDTLGHIAGDKVLKKVAECLKESFREEDFVARYGGDEFVILIPKITGEIAREKILNFVRNLKKRRFVSYKMGAVDINVSAGIATAEDGDTLEELVERADRAMYASKQGKTYANRQIST